MADRVDYLQQMMDMVGHCGKDGFTREGIQEMHGSEFFRTRWRITRCFCPSKEIKGHIAYRIRESHLAICTFHLGFSLVAEALGEFLSKIAPHSVNTIGRTPQYRVKDANGNEVVFPITLAVEI